MTNFLLGRVTPTNVKSLLTNDIHAHAKFNECQSNCLLTMKAFAFFSAASQANQLSSIKSIYHDIYLEFIATEFQGNLMDFLGRVQINSSKLFEKCNKFKMANFLLSRASTSQYRICLTW